MKPEINFTKVFCRFSSAMVFFLILILGGTHAFADTANETESSTQEMFQNAQEIEKLCETPEGEARIMIQKPAWATSSSGESTIFCKRTRIRPH
jgi:hypothetical protein